MGFVPSLLGIGGGNKGMQYKAKQADLLQGTNTNQTDIAYNTAQGALGRQYDFADALGAQNGIGNQSSVFGQQQGLASLLGAQALGYGPNPALAQLSQTTGQNVANQAALMAGQRGSAANAGLMARQIGQQGAGIQQQAVGQAAVMRAQQQLAAQQALQQQQQMMGGLATQQVGQQAGSLSTLNQAAQSEQQALLNSLAQYNATNVASQGNANNVNAGVQGQVARSQGDLLTGAMKGAGAAFGMAAHGGMVPQHYEEGGMVSPQGSTGPQSYVGKFLNGWAGNQGAQIGIPQESPMMPAEGSMAMSQTGQMMGSGMAKGMQSLGKSSPDMLGSGDLGMPTSAAKGGLIEGEMLASHGEMVPGKAEVKGDSLKNDKVPAMLSPKEIVIPRSITMSKDAPEKAKAFVAAVLAKNGMRK